MTFLYYSKFPAKTSFRFACFVWRQHSLRSYALRPLRHASLLNVFALFLLKTISGFLC